MYTRRGLLAGGDAAAQHGDYRHALECSSLDEATSETGNPRTSVTHVLRSPQYFSMGSPYGPKVYYCGVIICTNPGVLHKEAWPSYVEM